MRTEKSIYLFHRLSICVKHVLLHNSFTESDESNRVFLNLICEAETFVAILIAHGKDGRRQEFLLASPLHTS